MFPFLKWSVSAAIFFTAFPDLMPFARRQLRRLFPALSAAGLLALGGAALLPLRNTLETKEQSAQLQRGVPEFRRADMLGRQLAFFTLGGLRTLAAELLAMDATSAWLEQDWPRARERWQQITLLCPQRVNYRVRAARDMAKNAVAHVREQADKGELTAAEAQAAERSYLAAAEDFLRDGIADNPDSALLRLELGSFYDDLARRPQFSKAVDAYRDALAHGASPMYERWVFYNLCRIRGREQEAYELGRRLFTVPKHRTPSVRCLLFVLQKKLNTPEADRLTIAELFGTRDKAQKELRRFQHNDLRFPTTGIADFLEKR